MSRAKGEILEKKGLSAIQRYRMLEGGERILVAVSGGPDSLALLAFLNKLSREMTLELSIYHLNHMLRGEESLMDARFVEDVGRNMGIPVVVESLDVRSAAREKGKSIEDAAHWLRREKLEAHARQIGADRIAVGHTADDQVETFLMRAMKGAGLQGLAGIPPVSGIFVRPLIGVWREEVLDYLASMGLEWRLDSTNLDGFILRNQVRREVIPFLERQFGPSFKRAILRGAESLQFDLDYLDNESREAFERVSSVQKGRISLDIDGLLGMHESLRRRVLRDAWRRLMPCENPLGWRHLRDIERRLLEGRTGASLDLPLGVVVSREYGNLVFAPRRKEEKSEVVVSLDVGGSVYLPRLKMKLTAGFVDRTNVTFTPDRFEEYIRPDISLPLEVRFPRAGDRFCPLGLSGEKKLSDFFIDEKVSRSARESCPLVISGGNIVWIVGYRLDDKYKLRDEDSEAIRLVARLGDLSGG